MKMPCVWDGSAYTRRLHPISCTISLTLRPVSTVNMVLPPMDEINNFDWVEVPTPDGDCQYYMVSSVSTDTETGEKTVMLEHGACTLDSQIIEQPTNSRKTVSKKDTISNIVTFILQDQERWTVGTIESTDTIYIELGGSSLMTALLSIMDSIPDYQLEFVQNGANDWHIDIKERPTVPICEGRLSRNLVSCEIAYDAGRVCTRVYGDLPNGHMDSTNINIYGLHEESISLNNGLSTQQKQRIAQAYLNQHDHPAIGINISGLELSQITGLALDRFVPGTMCRIVIPWLGVVANEIIVEKRYSDPYNAPEQISISLANVVPDLSIAIAAVTGGGGGGGGKGGGIAGQANRYNTKFDQTDKYFRLIATDTEWDELGNGTLTAYGQLVVTSSSIQSVVNDIRNSGYSSITQLANSISLIVNDDNVVTPASIILAINENQSGAKIEADNLTFIGQNIKISADNIDINGLITALETQDLGVGKLHVEGESEFLKNIYCESYIVAEETITAGAGYYLGGKLATWQSKSVITSVGVTLPSITRSNTRQFMYAVNGDTTNPSTITGSIITGFSGGSVNPTSETIYYLGRANA